jgi:DNA helicase-2/ATP-dependent DNA helicase PcrA
VRSPLPAPCGLLAGLTPEQAQAVTHGTGPLLLLAGPGAGKTRTLTHRIVHLLESGQARPAAILAVTFSVRAATELRLRLAELLGERVACSVTAATFHAFCARLLREYAHLFGRTDRYTIYDQGDTRRVIEEILADQRRVAVQQALKAYGQPPAGELQALLSRAKSRLEDPTDGGGRDPVDRLVAAVWRESEVELRRSNAFDFDDLLWFAARLLREHRLRARWIRRRWRFLLVDEYQDINAAQAELVWLLAGADGNLTVVADDDQLVHRWRGADPAHVARFCKRYPRHETIVLSRSFRSRAEILDAATSCVRHNRRRTTKQLVAVRGTGGQVSVDAFYDDWHEARWIAHQVAVALAAGVPGPEILILARTSYATQPVRAALARAGIAHRVLGSLGLFERSEVKDALAYLTLLANPADAQAFRRAISSPRRGIGPATANGIATRYTRARGAERRPGHGVRASGGDLQHPISSRTGQAPGVWRGAAGGARGGARGPFPGAPGGQGCDARGRTRTALRAPARRFAFVKRAARRRASA